MKKVSGMAVQFLLILAALFSSAAAKTEAGKKVCVEHEADNVRTTSVVRTSIVFVYNDDILVSMRFLLNWKLHISVQVGAFDIWNLLCFFSFSFCSHWRWLHFMSEVMFIYLKPFLTILVSDWPNDGLTDWLTDWPTDWPTDWLTNMTVVQWQILDFATTFICVSSVRRASECL